MKIFFITALVIVTLVIAGLITVSARRFKEPEHVRVARTISSQVTREIYVKHGLHPSSDIAAMFGCVEEVGTWFDSGHPLTTEEASRLTILCEEAYLTAFNSNEQVRPFLIQYPFTSKNVTAGIFFFNPGRSDVYYPFPSSVIVSRGTLEVTYKFPKEENRDDLIIREPYEQARDRILGAQKQASTRAA